MPALAAALALGLIAALGSLSRVGAASAAPTASASTAPSAGPSTRPSFPPSGRILRVPSQFATIDLAIRASQRGDVILLAPGTYDGAVIPLDKPDITIRGEDRNTVRFDG